MTALVLHFRRRSDVVFLSARCCGDCCFALPWLVLCCLCVVRLC